jgi:signal transduction histidine kinase
MKMPSWYQSLVKTFLSLRHGLPTQSAEYQAWRHQFLLDRLKIILWIAFPVATVMAPTGLFTVFAHSPQFERDILRIYEDASLIVRMRSQALTNTGVLFAILICCWSLLRSRWGRRYPVVIFLLFSSVLTWSDMVVGTFFGIPTPPDGRFFLAQAIFIPVHWRLHLISQVLPITHYAIVYPLLGLTKVGAREFYSSYSIQRAIDLCWIMVVSILSVYLYEKLKHSEFESQRRLRSVIHAISHDLKNPAMGTSLLLQGLLQKPDSQLSIDRAMLEQLLAGSNRQINLIQSLLEVQSAEVGTLILHRQPLQLDLLVREVIEDFGSIVEQHHMSMVSTVNPNLPLVDVDRTQLWRVFNNLISNVLKHNPSGTRIDIGAELVQVRKTHWLRCTVQDNGVGIPRAQIPYLFELYTRGAKARRMPGLGLGLYLCQQIIIAHQGEIGIHSQPDMGSTFWFTIPVVAPNC